MLYAIRISQMQDSLNHYNLNLEALNSKNFNYDVIIVINWASKIYKKSSIMQLKWIYHFFSYFIGFSYIIWHQALSDSHCVYCF